MATSPELVVPVRLGFQPDRPIVIKATGAGVLPERKHDDDAGFDLYSHIERDTGSVWIGPGEFRDIPCGINIELPPGVWGLIAPRSSTLRDRRLHVPLGIIDTGYRGELFAGVQNLGDTVAEVKHGDRLAQLILLTNLAAYATMERVDSLASSARGANGFGSTGR